VASAHDQTLSCVEARRTAGQPCGRPPQRRLPRSRRRLVCPRSWRPTRIDHDHGPQEHAHPLPWPAAVPRVGLRKLTGIDHANRRPLDGPDRLQPSDPSGLGYPLWARL